VMSSYGSICCNKGKSLVVWAADLLSFNSYYVNFSEVIEHNLRCSTQISDNQF
jgi:hypothetical protein